MNSKQLKLAKEMLAALVVEQSSYRRRFAANTKELINLKTPYDALIKKVQRVGIKQIG